MFCDCFFSETIFNIIVNIMNKDKKPKYLSRYTIKYVGIILWNVILKMVNKQLLWSQK